MRTLRGWVCCLLAGLILAAAPARPALAVPQPPAAQEEFVPIDELPVEESIPAAPLLITAYAFAWLAVFAYLWSIWRRLSRVEREIADVARRLDAGARQ